VYVDLDVISNDLKRDISAPALRFQETRTSPYIDGDSADYLCSIIRFSIQTGSSLPVFISKIELGQPDENQTVHAITLRITGANGDETKVLTRHIQFNTTDATAPVPKKNASESGPLEHLLSCVYLY
jgi:hypothetical protein